MFAEAFRLRSVEKVTALQPPPTQPLPTGDVPSSVVVEGVRRREPDAMAMLFAFTSRVARAQLRRQIVWTEYEDRLHDVYVMVLEAILHDRIRQPESLPAFIATVARRQVCSHIREQVMARQKHVPLTTSNMDLPDSSATPESVALSSEKRCDMLRRLNRLKPLDREILSRFYLEGQDQPRICADLGITENQFRIRKSRAKARIAVRCAVVERPHAQAA